MHKAPLSLFDDDEEEDDLFASVLKSQERTKAENKVHTVIVGLAQRSTYSQAI